jgi:hypothetical protein
MRQGKEQPPFDLCPGLEIGQLESRLKFLNRATDPQEHQLDSEFEILRTTTFQGA